MTAPRINYQISRTINLGDYESVKVQIGIELDAGGDTAPHAAHAYTKAKAFVDRRIEEETKRWQV